MKRNKWISSKKYLCDRCKTIQPAYYTLSLLTKALWIQCVNCGNHARPYVPNLDLPYKPSKHYLKHTIQSRKKNQKSVNNNSVPYCSIHKEWLFLFLLIRLVVV